MYDPSIGLWNANRRKRLALSSALSRVVANMRVVALKSPINAPSTKPVMPYNSIPESGPSRASNNARPKLSKVRRTMPASSSSAFAGPGSDHPSLRGRSATRRFASASSRFSSQFSTMSRACDNAVSPECANAAMSARSRRGSAVMTEP